MNNVRPPWAWVCMSVWHDWAVMLFDGVTEIFKILRMNWDCRYPGSSSTKDRSLSSGAAYRPTLKPGQYSYFTGTAQRPTWSPAFTSTPSILWKKTTTLRPSPCPLSLAHRLVWLGNRKRPRPNPKGPHVCQEGWVPAQWGWALWKCSGCSFSFPVPWQ